MKMPAILSMGTEHEGKQSENSVLKTKNCQMRSIVFRREAIR
jgi:hypothetical protein